jgi:YggT family protein
MVYLANAVRFLFSIYIILIFVRILFAWLRPNMFNPLVRFVYKLTDPYLKLFAGMRFIRIGALDLSPIFAFYVLYLLQELLYNLILRGHITLDFVVLLAITYFFRFVYFILFIFMITVALRFIFGFIRMRENNVFVNAIYSISEPAVRPFRNLLKVQRQGSFDIAALLSLVVLILARFFILPRLLVLIEILIKGSGLS